MGFGKNADVSDKGGFLIMGAKRDIECPFCSAVFEGETWDNGECPKCKKGYYWEEWHTEDDFGAELLWE